jgi:hypothetical protein
MRCRIIGTDFPAINMVEKLQEIILRSLLYVIIWPVLHTSIPKIIKPQADCDLTSFIICCKINEEVKKKYR